MTERYPAWCQIIIQTSNPASSGQRHVVFISPSPSSGGLLGPFLCGHKSGLNL